MGMDVTVPTADGGPGWSEVASRLHLAGRSVRVMMIDVLPAFPDEMPADDWRELRVGNDAGMVTIRREAGAWRLVTWGSDDPALTVLRAAVADAVHKASRGPGAEV